MADLKLRRLNELNSRLKEDLERPRIRVSEASMSFVEPAPCYLNKGDDVTNCPASQVDTILYKYKRLYGSIFVGFSKHLPCFLVHPAARANEILLASHANLIVLLPNPG